MKVSSILKADRAGQELTKEQLLALSVWYFSANMLDDEKWKEFKETDEVRTVLEKYNKGETSSTVWKGSEIMKEFFLLRGLFTEADDRLLAELDYGRAELYRTILALTSEEDTRLELLDSDIIPDRQRASDIASVDAETVCCAGALLTAFRGVCWGLNEVVDFDFFDLGGLNLTEVPEKVSKYNSFVWRGTMCLRQLGAVSEDGERILLAGLLFPAELTCATREKNFFTDKEGLCAKDLRRKFNEVYSETNKRMLQEWGRRPAPEPLCKYFR